MILSFLLGGLSASFEGASAIASTSVEEQVAQKLLEQGDKELVDLWRLICDLYEEGGPDLVESHFVKKSKEIRSKFSKEFKEIEAGTPIVKAKKTARRRR